jgi:hypothetical protein
MEQLVCMYIIENIEVKVLWKRIIHTDALQDLNLIFRVNFKQLK